MATRDNEIGKCRCPVCGSPAANLRVSVKQLAYVMCNNCNCQIMARSDRSDKELRALHIAAPAPAAEPVRTAVAPVVQTAVTPPPAPPTKPKPSWGFRGLVA